MAIIIDGKATSQQLRIALNEQVAAFKEAHGTVPGLAVVLVGEDPASAVYVRNKHRACEEVGMYSEVHRLPAETSEEELLALIDRLNQAKNIHGILVQLPLPKHLDEAQALAAVDWRKDVDGFHLMNAGALLAGQADVLPCTPAGCIELLKRSGVAMQGANAVVIGRSNIVGKPMALLLLQENCTVTVCHSKTQNLGEITRNADILVAAIGKPNFVKGDMIKSGAAVIDVGINRLENGALCGDVDFEQAQQVAGWITPVPGGVGPMTIAMLMENTVKAAEKYAR